MASKTIQQYRAMLAINKHRLDDEMETQSDIQERLSTETAALNRRMLEAKDDLAKIEARLAEEIKDREEKLTVDAVKGKVLRHRDRQTAFAAYMEALEEHEVAKGVLDAWRQRGYLFTNLGGLYAAQYFSPRSAGAPRERPVRSERRDDRAARYAEDSVREALGDAPVLPRRRRREE